MGGAEKVQRQNQHGELTAPEPIELTDKIIDQIIYNGCR